MKVFVILFVLNLIAVSSTAHRLPPNLAQMLDDNLGYVPLNKPNKGRIVGGIETTIDRHPYQVVMFKGGFFVCSASIISTQWTLTAAHCLDESPTPNRIRFRVGSTDRTRGGRLVTAVSYEIHPKYDMWTSNYDIAVVKVTPSLTGTNIKPISLPTSGTELIPSTLVTISGWGRTEIGSLPIKLRVILVPLVDYNTCKKYWENSLDTMTMICAGVVMRDSCNGDSGGPLVQNGVLYGVVSFGNVRCGSDVPSVYVKVSNSDIRDFIKEQTGV